MKKLLFIYNQTAGTGKVRARLGDIVEQFAARGYEVTLHPTTGPGDATAFARTRAGEFDRIVCAGGDGTLSEVVTGLLDAENAPPLGYIPTGTTNDFSRTLGLPGAIVEAAKCAASGVPGAVDVGLFNGRPFVYVAAFGLFSDVSYTTPQKMKNSLGHLAYVLSGIPQLASITSYHMRVAYDDVEIEDDFIYGMVSDTVTVGGILDLNRDTVRVNDGQFEGLLVKMPRNLAELNELVVALRKQEYEGKVVGFQAERVTITCDTEVPWTLDGEYGGACTRAEISVLPRAVTLVTNPDAQAMERPAEPPEET